MESRACWRAHRWFGFDAHPHSRTPLVSFPSDLLPAPNTECHTAAKGEGHKQVRSNRQRERGDVSVGTRVWFYLCPPSFVPPASV
jgi:hypothetical protein